MNGQAIIVKNLDKRFEDVHAVNDVSFEIHTGEIFSLLGPNGAGKTTTIGMISGLLTPNAGEVWLMGHSMSKESNTAKAELGVVPQEIALYDDISARANLNFWGKMYGLQGKELGERVDAVLALIELEDHAYGAVSKFSGGMKRRLNVGVALLHQPKVIIMDEPTVGIDPQSRRKILNFVKHLRDQGVTILYTTHYMEEAQELSDRIAIMDHGKIIVQERKSGALDRLLTTAISKISILAGHWLAMFGMIFLQFIVLVIFGQLFLRLDFFAAPIATLILSLASCAFVASMGLLIGILAKIPEQTAIYALIPMFLFSGLGGAWLPIDILGEQVQQVSKLTPVYWIMTGFKDILLRGAGLSEILFPILVLVGFSVLFFIPGLVLFYRKRT